MARADTMSLLPDSATFHERVQDLFSAYRGKGLALSAIDVELVDRWAALAVPFEVVAQGLRKAAEAALYDAAADEKLASLAACRRTIDAEISRYQKRTAGRREDLTAAGAEAEPLATTMHKKLKGALRRAAKLQPGLAPAVETLLSRLPTPADFDASVRQEELAFAALLRALPFPARLAVLRRVGAVLREAPSLSAAARREAARFHRTVLCKRALGL